MAAAACRRLRERCFMFIKFSVRRITFAGARARRAACAAAASAFAVAPSPVSEGI
ncbi:MAG: hypothetical protein WEA28_05000 [Xanthobacteraceae bacterium]